MPRELERLASRLELVAAALGGSRYLEHLCASVAQPIGSEWQVALYEEMRDLREVVRRLVDESRRALIGLAPRVQPVPLPPGCSPIAPLRLDLSAGLPVA